MNWQPIESAPRDGTSILCACQFWPGGTWIYLVLAFDDDPALPTHPWATLDGPSYAEDVPKLWQPIPEPPEAE